MGCLGDALWLLFCGFVLGVCWAIAGVFWCITIIGIPIGLQCFKFMALSFFPFGKDIRYSGAIFTLSNVLWVILSGIPLAVIAGLYVLLLCLTIIGIPFGVQCFKLAKLALMPFGASVVES